MKTRSHFPRSLIPLLILAPYLAACGAVTAVPTATPTAHLQATIVAAVDLGAGGAGFTAVVYAQEVHSGSTFHTIMPAGSHGLVVLPTSPPVSFMVDAPGTYVFYAVLINEDSYHFGSTACRAATECDTHDLIAREVLPNETYEVYIGDASALIPPTAVPVTVPWHP